MIIMHQVPLAYCSQKQCDGCDIRDKILCVADTKDVIDFFVLFIIVFIPFIAGMIIGQFWQGIIAWLALAAIFFGYVEALVLCRHCPHYGEKGFFLRCHANYGLPKIPKFDPRPLNRLEKTVWVAYACVLLFWYVPFFIISGQWLLFIITTIAVFAAIWTLTRTQCNRCYNLSCPINRVPQEIRDRFYEKFPAFDNARK